MVSVSIVTYHTPLSELDTCLRSLDSEHISRIYIIDNSRNDDIRLWAKRHNGIIYIPSDNNGYGAGHNQAIRRELELSDTAYHLVMNSDLEFSPVDIERIHAFMDTHHDIGTLQPAMTDENGEKQYTCRMLPTPFDVFIRRFMPKCLFVKAKDRYLLKHLDHSIAWDIPYHQGSFMFIRKDALRDTGVFDERFFMYPEDIDLTRRLHRKYRTIYWPDVTIIHRHRAASYHSMRMLYVHISNMIRYFNKWGWVFDSERKKFNSEIKRYDYQ